MLIVQKGWVTHNGVTYGRGQALPKMKRADELRLLDLGTCYEGDIPELKPAPKEETPPPANNEGDNEGDNTGVGDGEGSDQSQGQANGTDINLNFDPDENIKPKSKG